jgi:hypothetical protein
VKLSEMTEDQFREHVAAEAPHLLDALSGVDEEALEARLAEMESRLATADERVDERARELLDERERQRGYAEKAKTKIEKAEGLTEGHRTDLLARYSIVDGKPAAGLLVDSEEKLDEAVKGDVDHALELIRESRPGPRVNGLGDGEEDESKSSSKASGGWAGHLQELAIMPLDKDGNPDKAKLLDGMVN